MQYFTADLHLGHANIIKYCNRPFAHVDEMDDTIIKNVFSRLRKGDNLFVLGDLSFNERTYVNFIEICNAKEFSVTLIKGNHDPRNIPFAPFPILDIKIEGQKITLCHYAMRTWNCSCHGAWQLYGHSHGRLPPIGKQWDVGIDNNNFYPISFNEIKTIMETREDNEDLVTKEN
jgi:calcineurin-like phosphoesterase family protein